MRRQARISAGGALIVRTASALQVWLWLLIFIFQNEFRISRSIKPGYLDFDNLPETNFTCTGKVIGGYYADTETSCQMFHVCTVGQNEEPMDIKFLCLNGTVFDQETRVCERVDEVDCTKSEKFYSLNLELYGSTTPPIIEPEQKKPQAQPTEQSQQQTKPNQEKDPSPDDVVTTSHDKTQGHSTDPTDYSTEDPIQEIKKDEYKPVTDKSTNSPIQLSGIDELEEDYQEEEEDIAYEDYSHYHKPTSTQSTTSSTTTTTTTTTTRPPTTMIPPATSPRHPPSIPHLISSPTPILSTLSPPSFSPSAASVPSTLSAPSAPSGFSAPSGPSVPSLSTLDPSLLTPREFIYRHRGPGSEAISFQRHSFRPADGVYITHAPPQQYDHFQYESSRTAPRPTPQRPQPAPFVPRPQPAQFRSTTLNPREQLLRPVPTSQHSERHETSVKQNKPPSYSQSLPQQSLPFNPFYFDRKRSDESIPEVESSLSARSVAPPNITEKPPIKLKSPPRVIVTASASVSDSNGKKLNYTVGNVVSAVKPIVPINYDDYKESDLIFDPFFLDVPKLQIRRKTRSNKKGNLVTIPSTATLAAEVMAHNSVTLSPVTSRATTTQEATSDGSILTTTATWSPDDYVDDNYEPHAYIPPPIAVLVLYDPNKSKEKSRSKNALVDSKTQTNLKINTEIEQSKPTSASAPQTSSSQSAAVGNVSPAASPPPAPLLEAPTCTHSSDCRTRA